MPSSPAVSAVIHLLNKYYLDIYFTRPVDADVLQDLHGLSLHHGIEVYQSSERSGKPLSISLSQAYDSKEVGLEVERMLRKHGFSNLSIKIDRPHASDTVSTLEPSSQNN